MKVLFVSNYRDNSGWAHAAQSYILAMDSVGIQVVPRCIKLNKVKGAVPARILELEKQSDKKCDIIIQNVLPQMMTYSGSFDKNIGLCYVETRSFNSSSWPQYLNTMDEVWVPSEYNRAACENSHVDKPVRVVPIAVDEQKFLQGYKPIDIPEARYNFTFYFIGENTRRKNLPGLLEAFHNEFRQSEPVHLVIKTNQPGVSADVEERTIQETIKRTKQSLKKHTNISAHKQETLVLGSLSETDICRLHVTCDCLVAPSLGESWHIPCQEAMLFGNTPIYTGNLGMDDYCDEAGRVMSHPVPAIGALDTFSDLCTSNDTWYEPSILSMQEKMRSIYEHHEYRKEILQAGLSQLDSYTYQTIGRRIKESLEKS